MKAKHTEGPWQAVVEWDDGRVATIHAFNRADPIHIADVLTLPPERGDDGDEQAKANAAVMAAAPALFAVCEAAAALGKVANDVRCMSPDLARYIDDVVSKARAAIAATNVGAP